MAKGVPDPGVMVDRTSPGKVRGAGIGPDRSDHEQEVPVRRVASPETPARGAARTYFRHVKASDRRELLVLTRSSRELHYPWISPPLTSHMFKVYLRRTQRDDHEGYAICLMETDEIVGVINLNNVVKGAFRSASAGYYAAQAHVGRGYMREGLAHVTRHAFRELGLHRIEANIQPANTASIRLVRSCGFQREGLSPRFLYINGTWRDHERWAAIDPRVGLT